MEKFTPVALRDLYLLLSKEDRHAFLKLIAVHCTGYEPLMMLEELPRTELWKYNSIVFGSLIKTALPILLKHARELAKKKPDLGGEVFDRELEAMLTEYVETERDVVSKLARETVKKERDPKPRKTERDAEILRLAKQGKTSGEIHRAIKGRWECTVGAVNQVMIRAKRAGQLPS